jgi:phage virion morphogenesis protein
MADIELDAHAVTLALRNLKQTIGDITPVLEEIGEELVYSTKQRFGSTTGPDGHRWEENSPVTLEHKRGNRPLTGETGSLRDEINKQLLDPDTLAIVSPMEYSAMQQFGGTKAEFPNLWGDIPARPFLGISDEDNEEILDIIQSHLSAAMN